MGSNKGDGLARRRRDVNSCYTKRAENNEYHKRRGLEPKIRKQT